MSRPLTIAHLSESESEVLFLLGQQLAQRAPIKVPSKKYNTQHKRARQKVQLIKIKISIEGHFHIK